MTVRTRYPIMALVAALLAASVVSVPVPAVAIPQRSADWYKTKAVADYDPRSSVVAAAYGAIASRNVDAAVARFIARDYDFAKRRAALNDSRNTDFCNRVLATHTAEFAPEVHAAAQYALDHDPADRAAFARTGYDQAKARDRQAREASGEQAAALAEFDRDFVAVLRDSDPGEQVRAAAAYALRPAATDGDLVEFFAHSWTNAASLDLAAFRIRVTDEDMRWRAGVADLLATAQAAEQAALGTAGEAAEQNRAVAARAWSAVGAQTGAPRVVWADAQRVAEEQAANWHRVVQAAGGTTSVTWEVITGSAGTTAGSWATEREQADLQAAYWADLYSQALAGELRMSSGGVA